MRESDFRGCSLFLLGDLQAKFTLKKSKPTGKYYTKGRIIIIQISKEEAHALHEGHNVPWKDNGISTSRSKHGKKYYLCEHYKNLQALNEIRGVKPRKNKPNFKNKRVGV